MESRKCPSCSSKMKKTNHDYHYSECGLKNIVLKKIDAFICNDCGEEEHTIPNIEDLHSLLAKTIASQKNRLLPEEIRFLRSQLGFSGVNFAKTIGVTPESVSRWEHGKEVMSTTTERLLRMIVLSNAGPFRDYVALGMYGLVIKKTAQKREFIVIKNKWQETA